MILKGKVRLNKAKIDKSSYVVRSGDVITIALGPRVRVLEVKGIATRRGPASEACGLYAELTPRYEAPKSEGATDSAIDHERSNSQAARPLGSGRPTKKDRRAIVRLKGGSI